jgi:hypothetical protein
MKSDQQQLLEYLLGALESSEKADVERELLQSPSFQKKFLDVKEEIAPLLNAFTEYVPPRGLAVRTCRQLWPRIDEEMEVLPKSSVPSPHVALSVASAPVRSVDNLPLEGAEYPPRSVSSSISVPQSLYFHSSEGSFTAKPKRQGKISSTLNVSHWRFRDVIASVLVGLLLAVILLPAARMAINHTRNVVYRQQIQQFSQKMPMIHDSNETLSPKENKQSAYLPAAVSDSAKIPVINVTYYSFWMSQKSMTYPMLQRHVIYHVPSEKMRQTFPWITFDGNPFHENFQPLSRPTPVFIFTPPLTPVSSPPLFPVSSSPSQNAFSVQQ